MRKFILLGFVGLFIWLAGCSDSTEPRPDLVARVSLSINLRESHIPLSLEFVLDPTMTESKLSPADSLTIRWDLDGDGEWDTDFGKLQLAYGAPIPHLPFGTWTARCEVRDEAGNSSIAEDSITLPAWLPSSSDLVVGDLIVTDEYWSHSDVDSFAVGTEFYLQLPARMWGDHMMITATFRYFVDGVLATEEDVSVPGPFFPLLTAVFPKGPFEALESGSHLIEVELVLPSTIEEADSTNNRRSGTVVWVGAN